MLSRSALSWRVLGSWAFSLLLCCILLSPAREKEKELFIREIILGARLPARDRLTPSSCRNQACFVLYPKFLVYKMTSSCHKLCICQCNQSYFPCTLSFLRFGFCTDVALWTQSLQNAMKHPGTSAGSRTTPRFYLHRCLLKHQTIRWSFESLSGSSVLKVTASTQIKGCDFIMKLVCDVRL